MNLWRRLIYLKKQETENAGGFSKEQLLKSKRYQDRVDLLSALLLEEKSYTLEEADAVIENFLKRKVI